VKRTIIECLYLYRTQWAVYYYDNSDCIFFIGLFQSKYSNDFSDCNKYKIEDIDCNDVDLHGSSCDSFKNARQAASISVAIVVLTLLFKIVLLVLCKMGTKPKMLWISTIIALSSDLVLFFCTFIAAGQFETIMNNGIFDDVEFDHGYGWKCFLGGGFIALLSFIQLVVMTFVMKEPVGELDSGINSNKA
jgi:hypothetical protein